MVSVEHQPPPKPTRPKHLNNGWRGFISGFKGLTVPSFLPFTDLMAVLQDQEEDLSPLPRVSKCLDEVMEVI